MCPRACAEAVVEVSQQGFPGCRLLHVNRWRNIAVCLEVRWILNIQKEQPWRFRSSEMWRCFTGCVVTGSYFLHLQVQAFFLDGLF